MGFLRADKTKYHGNDERMQALALLEEKRALFAARLREAGFSPEEAYFSTTGRGGFDGIARQGKEIWLLTGPGPYEEGGEFGFEKVGEFSYSIEQVSVPGEGMNGVLGFGKRPLVGTAFHVTGESGRVYDISFVMGESCILTVPGMSCHLADEKRKAGDANFAFDMRPVEPKDERKTVPKVVKLLEAYGTALPAAEV